MSENNRKIFTLDNIKASEANNREVFVGGSERSGQATLGPQRLFQRLVEAAELTTGIGENLHTLHIWSDGFSVDDGPLRSPQSEDGSAFLRDLLSERIPAELGNAREIKVDDQHTQPFPKHIQRPFGGQGRVLGSPAPVFNSPAHIQQTTYLDADVPQDDPILEALRCLDVHRDEEQTSLAIRLPDGERMCINVNPDRHTINDIRNFVIMVRTDLAFAEFDLLTGPPSNTRFDDDRKTVRECNLCKAVVIVKPVKEN